MSDGKGGCGKHEPWGTGLDFRLAPDQTVMQILAYVKVSEKEKNYEKERAEKKVTVTQGGTRTHNLANGLPCSNQLSYFNKISQQNIKPNIPYRPTTAHALDSFCI